MKDAEYFKEEYKSKIKELIAIQRNEKREAIFFIYANGSTSEIIKGENTHIKINRDKQKRLFSSGKVIGSIHTHPSGFDVSSIDTMMAISTNQDYICVAVPIVYEDGERDFTLSCVDLSDAGPLDRRRLFRAMRRISFGVNVQNMNARKQLNFQLSRAQGSRTHEVVKDGVSYPALDRPSVLEIERGHELGVTDSDSVWFS